MPSLTRGDQSSLGVWTTLAEARQEVIESISADRVSRVARSADGAVIGWIGAIREYDGLVWQLHPIVVDEAHRRNGVGRALVQDLEAILTSRGALMLWAGREWSWPAGHLSREEAWHLRLPALDRQKPVTFAMA